MGRRVPGSGGTAESVLRRLSLPAIALLVSCQPGPQSTPTIPEADARAVQGFLRAYGRRDLDGMMRYLDEDAVFRGTENTLSKAQIRDFFQATFQKHPDLLVEAGPLKEVQGTIQVRVTVQTRAIWTDTWIFEMRNHRIHAYALASGMR